MSSRRNQPTNQWGCKPDGDVCVKHDDVRVCRHGCALALHPFHCSEAEMNKVPKLPPKHTCDVVKGSFGCRVCDEMDPRTKTPPRVRITPKESKQVLATARQTVRDAKSEKRATADRAAELLQAVTGLNADEQAVVFGVAMRVAARMHKGRMQYGPLDLSPGGRETRDFADEMYEEALDGANYGEMRRIQSAHRAASPQPLPPRSARKKPGYRAGKKS